MIIRQATSADIPQIQTVRNSVKENALSNPALVPDSDVENFINVRGRGWVCEIDRKIVGFAIADLQDNNVWALFLDPEFEKKGIGRKLHDTMLEWYFTTQAPNDSALSWAGQRKKDIWLGTAPGTRAEEFYRKTGWRENGVHLSSLSNGEKPKEIRFEMTRREWENLKNSPNTN